MKNNKYFEDFGITDNTNQGDNMLQNLFKKPKKETRDEMPHFTEKPDMWEQQCDLLFLPEDKGYKYCLVCVDQGSEKTRFIN